MRHLALILLALLGAAFSGCDSSEDPPEPEFALDARVDGRFWKADEFAEHRPTTLNGVEHTSIYGISSDDERVLLLTTEPITEPGEYDITLSGDDVPSYYWNAGAGGPTYSATSGRVTIREVEGSALYGTFVMEAEADDGTTVSVRDGRITGLTTQP